MLLGKTAVRLPEPQLNNSLVALHLKEMVFCSCQGQIRLYLMSARTYLCIADFLQTCRAQGFVAFPIQSVHRAHSV